MYRSMNIKSLAVGMSALVLSASVNASLIDNGVYTTDDTTGLQWLDLSSTFGLTHETAENFKAGGGWRHASIMRETQI